MVIIENVCTKLYEFEKENKCCLNYLNNIKQQIEIQKEDMVEKTIKSLKDNEKSLHELDCHVLNCDLLNKTTNIETKTIKDLLNWAFVTESVLESVL